MSYIVGYSSPRRLRPIQDVALGLVVVFAACLTQQSAAGMAIGEQTSSPTVESPEQAGVDGQGRIFDLVVRRRELISGASTLRVKKGERVTIRITCDEREQLHLHGYNKLIELFPGQPATLDFKADRAGRFEYELEKSETELGALEVLPE